MSKRVTPIVVESKRGAYTVRRKGGDAGALQSVRIAANFLQNDLGLFGGEYDKGMERFAQDVVAAFVRVPRMGRRGVTPHFSDRQKADAIHRYCCRVPYFPDPAGGIERVIDARETLKNPLGVDCLNRVLLESELLAFNGLHSWWSLVRFDIPGAAPQGFDHVDGFVELDGEWVPFDSTPDLDTDECHPLGWHVQRRVIKRAYFDPFGGAADTQTLQGFLSALKKVGSAALKIAPIAVNVIPGIGQVASAAIIAGSGLASQAVEGAAAKGAAVKEAKGQWGGLVNSTLATLNGIQSPGHVVTQADYETAAAAVAQLESVASQLAEAGVKDVAKQWADPNYGPAFNKRLSDIKAAVVKPSASTALSISSAAGSALATGAGGFNLSPTVVLLGGGAALLVLLLVLMGRGR